MLFSQIILLNGVLFIIYESHQFINLLKDASEIKHKACVFDLDGVLRVGRNVLDRYLLKHLNERGVKTMILTNECRYTIDDLKDELNEIEQVT